MYNNNIIEELLWRGLIKDKTPGIDYILKKKKITLYIGFDPTYDSLHIGSLVAILIIIHFQKFGHKVIIVIGDGTTMVGDPSYKKVERDFLNKKDVFYNSIKIKNQLKFFLKKNFNYEILSNYNWIKKIYFVDFLREIGKNITVNYMKAKESVKKRLNNKNIDGLSFTEFSYQLIQAYDFYYLNKNKNCILQIGGSDQWGNITTGIELIKRKTGNISYGITFPLTINSHGNKFGKSEDFKQNIWLASEYTSPYKFYQYWLNISDDESEKLIKIYTFLNKSKIEKIIYEHKLNPKKRTIQKFLAELVTRMVHGDNILKNILLASDILFNKNIIKLFEKLDKKTFVNIFSCIQNIYISNNELIKGISIIDFLLKNRIFFSKKRIFFALKAKALLVNKQHVDEKFCFSNNNIIGNHYIILQYGKKNHIIIKNYKD